jgi:hypothetical protein
MISLKPNTAIRMTQQTMIRRRTIAVTIQEVRLGRLPPNPPERQDRANPEGRGVWDTPTLGV